MAPKRSKFIFWCGGRNAWNKGLCNLWLTCWPWWQVVDSWRTSTKACEMLRWPPSTVCIFGLSCCRLLLCGRWMLSLRVACLSGWGQNCCIRCFYLPTLYFPIIFPYYHEVTFPFFGAQSTCLDFDFHASIRRVGCWWTPNHFLPSIDCLRSPTRQGTWSICAWRQLGLRPGRVGRGFIGRSVSIGIPVFYCKFHAKQTIVTPIKIETWFIHDLGDLFSIFLEVAILFSLSFCPESSGRQCSCSSAWSSRWRLSQRFGPAKAQLVPTYCGDFNFQCVAIFSEPYRVVTLWEEFGIRGRPVLPACAFLLAARRWGQVICSQDSLITGWCECDWRLMPRQFDSGATKAFVPEEGLWFLSQPAGQGAARGRLASMRHGPWAGWSSE